MLAFGLLLHTGNSSYFSTLFRLAEGVCLLGHIIKHSEMPAGLRGREVDNGTLDVLIGNNGLFRQLCSLILPDWPLVWIFLIPTIHSRAALRDPVTHTHAPAITVCLTVQPGWHNDTRHTYQWFLENHQAVNDLIWDQAEKWRRACVLSNDQQGTTPLVAKRCPIEWKSMRKWRYFSFHLLSQ